MTAAASSPSELRAGQSPLPPADYIAETRALYDSHGYAPYRWAEHPDPPPWTPITKPLAECRVTLIGSGGIYRHGQVAFHTRDDTSIRIIAADTHPSELRTAHFAYDETDARRDPDCVFPLARLRELHTAGVIGPVTDAAGFMGGIYSTRRVEDETAPRLLDHVREHDPDIVLLVPV